MPGNINRAGLVIANRRGGRPVVLDLASTASISKLVRNLGLIKTCLML